MALVTKLNFKVEGCRSMIKDRGFRIYAEGCGLELNPKSPQDPKETQTPSPALCF